MAGEPEIPKPLISHRPTPHELLPFHRGAAEQCTVWSFRWCRYRPVATTSATGPKAKGMRSASQRETAISRRCISAAMARVGCVLNCVAGYRVGASGCARPCAAGLHALQPSSLYPRIDRSSTHGLRCVLNLAGCDQPNPPRLSASGQGHHALPTATGPICALFRTWPASGSCGLAGRGDDARGVGDQSACSAPLSQPPMLASSSTRPRRVILRQRLIGAVHHGGAAAAEPPRRLLPVRRLKACGHASKRRFLRSARLFLFKRPG
jgi:hypothetical protein